MPLRMLNRIQNATGAKPMSWNAMLEDEQARGLTDRIALSHELATLSERFTDEAQQWKEPGSKEALNRDARLLAELSRHALSGTANESVVTSYAEAAAILITNVAATRRF